MQEVSTEAGINHNTLEMFDVFRKQFTVDVDVPKKSPGRNSIPSSIVDTSAHSLEH